jgi:hypothetical protein
MQGYIGGRKKKKQCSGKKKLFSMLGDIGG